LSRAVSMVVRTPADLYPKGIGSLRSPNTMVARFIEREEARNPRRRLRFGRLLPFGFVLPESHARAILHIFDVSLDQSFKQKCFLPRPMRKTRWGRAHHRELHGYGDEASWWAGVNVDPVPIALALWRRTRPDQSSRSPSDDTRSPGAASMGVADHDALA
jgi:hypothetical protein